MRAAKELCEAAELGVGTKPKSMKPDDVRALLEAFQGERVVNGKAIKLLSPPTNCLSPIEEMLIKKGCLLYTSPSPRDLSTSRMPSSA